MADASVVQLVKPLPPNLSVFCCHEFNSGLRQAGVPDFQKCINFGRHWGNNPVGKYPPHNQKKMREI